MKKVYVVTGGSGGIGLECAKKFVDGIVVICDINQDGLKAGREKLESFGIKVETTICDVSKKEDVESLVAFAKSFGEIAGVVHTAGVSGTCPNLKVIMNVDIVGTARIIQGFLGNMAKGGAMICTASMMGHMVPDNAAYDGLLANPLEEGFIDNIMPFLQEQPPVAYNFAKKGVHILCRDFSTEYGKNGNRIISISPGIIETPMAVDAAKNNPNEMAQMKALTPVGRNGKPEEIANLVAFLVSDQASFISGCDIRIDGGLIPNLKKAYGIN